jgi:hypothetical protein
VTLATAVRRSADPAPAAEPRQLVRSGDSAVLVLRALGLGDALTGVPALRGLRRAWPERWLLLAADPGIGGWLRQLGLVDEVLPTAGLSPLAWPPPGLIGGSRHIAVNVHGSGPQSHLLLSATTPDRLVAFRQPSAGFDDGPPWDEAEHEVDRWCRLVGTVGGPCGHADLYLAPPGHRSAEILLHPGAAAAARRWPADRWALLAAHLLATGHRVTLTGGPAETDLCAGIVEAAARATGRADRRPDSTSGRLQLPALAHRVATARLLVSGDTGVAHLATAYRTPSVLLFGPTSPRRWGPAVDPQLHTVLWHGADDRPGDPHGSVVDPALAAIEVAEVLDAVGAALR